MKKNKQTYIALDLDGTVIDDGNKIDEETFVFLEKLNEEHPIIIATGRPYRASKYYYDLLNLSTPIINYNGSYIHHPKDESFPTMCLHVDKNAISNLIDDLNDDFINAFCEIKDDIYLWSDNQEVKDFLFIEGGNLKIGKFNDTLPSNPNGGFLITKKGSEARLLNIVETKYKDCFNIRIWYNDREVISEIYHLNTSKAYGLQVICDYYDIDPKQIIAIGDGHNDLEMISFAGLGVAMANSHQDLLTTADVVINSINNNGVRHFLKKYFQK